MSEQTLPGREACPGQMAWSAFGAYYPDTVCATALEWNPGTDPGAVLCDADDDFRPKDVPCPFCAPDRFIDYQWAVSLGEHVITSTTPRRCGGRPRTRIVAKSVSCTGRSSTDGTKRRRFRRRLAAFSEAMGIALLPWQVHVMERLAFDGDKRGPRV